MNLKKLLALLLSLIMLVGLLPVSALAELLPLTLAETKDGDTEYVPCIPQYRLYLVPNSNWRGECERFALYLVNSVQGTDKWVSMSPYEDGRYFADIDFGKWTGVTFCGMKYGSTENSWDACLYWTVTPYLFPDDGCNCFVLSSDATDSASGSWSFYDDEANLNYLQQLVDAAEAGSTITLERDYAKLAEGSNLIVNKALTIDLGGHTVSGTDVTYTYLITVDTDGVLTVLDSSAGHTGAILCGNTCFKVEGSLTVNNCRMEGGTDYERAGADNGGCIYAMRGSHVTVNGGSLSGRAKTGGGAIFAFYAEVGLSNLTISGSSSASGGAINADGSAVTLSNCSLSGTSPAGGGAMYASSSSVTLTGCTVSGTSDSSGGALYLYATSLEAANCVFENCVSGALGGAIYINIGSELCEIENSTVSNCTAQANGGAMYVETGSVSITANSAIENCVSQNGIGGAFYLVGGTLELTDSTVADCSATTGSGGMAFVSYGTLSLTNARVSGCTASVNGGAIMALGGTTKITDSTVTGCWAGIEGGGIYCCTTTKLSGKVVISGNTSSSNNVTDNMFFTNTKLTIDGPLTEDARIGIGMSYTGARGQSVTNGLKGKGGIENFFSDDGYLVKAIDNNGEAYFGTPLTLSFEAGEGTGTMGSIAVPYYISLPCPACGFTPPEGKGFLAWQGDGMFITAGDSGSIVRDTSLTAVWTEYRTLSIQGAGAENQTVKWSYVPEGRTSAVTVEGVGITSFPKGAKVTFPNLRSGFTCNIPLTLIDGAYGAENVTEDIILTMPEAYPVTLDAQYCSMTTYYSAGDSQVTFTSGTLLQPGDNIRFIIDPNYNHELSTLTVTYTDDGGTHEIEYTYNAENGDCRFTMPAHPVTVSAVCILDEWGELQALIDAGGTILNQNYQMGDNDVTLTVSGNVTIDLNGYAIRGNYSYVDDVFQINRGGSLTMMDSDIGGRVIGGRGRAFYNNGTLVLESVNLSGGEVTASVDGAGVCSDGTFIMNEGTITGFVTTGRGAAVFVGGGSFTMNGGQIANNKSTNSTGGGVYASDGIFTVNGGLIGDNSAQRGGGIFISFGTVVLSGMPTISNNHGAEYDDNISVYQGVLSVDGDLDDNASVGVNAYYIDDTDESFTVTELNNSADASVFFADRPDQVLFADGTTLKLDQRVSLSFAANYGTGSMDSMFVTKGTAVELPDCGFTPPEHDYFSGWRIDGEVYSPGDSYVVNGDTVATAVWTRKQQIWLYAENGSGDYIIDWVKPNEYYVFPACPFTPPEHEYFRHWRVGGAEYSPGSSILVTGSVDAQAVYSTMPKLYFDANGGTGSMDTQWLVPGAAYTLPQCDFVSPDYMYFIGWSINSVTYSAGQTVSITANTTAYAVWSGMARVVFYPNGGSGVVDGVWVPIGESLTLPECGFAPPSHMHFTGWSLGDTLYQPGQSVVIEGDVSINAAWGWNDTEISFDAHGGTGEMEPVYVEFNSYYQLPLCGFTPPEGGSFIGWSINGAVYQAGAYYRVTGIVTAIALWGGVVYTVSFEPEAGSGSMEPVGAVTDVEFVFPECGFTPPEHQFFIGWTIGSTWGGIYQPGNTYTVTDDIVVYARWQDMVKVEFASNGASGSMDDVWLIPNSSYTLPECGFSAPEHQHFAGWKPSDSNNTLLPGYTVNVPVNTTFTARWEQIYVIVSFNANGASGNMSSQNIAEGDTYILPECGFNVPAHQRFVGWECGGVIYQPGTEITASANVQYTAVWEDITFTVSFLNGGGTGTMEPEVLVEGSDYYLPSCGFTAPAHQRFAGWEKNGTIYHKGQHFYIEEDMCFTALWEDIILTVRFSNGGGSGSVDPAQYLHGTEITLPECSFTPPANKYFLNWRANDTAYQPSDVFTVTQDVTFTAVWGDKVRLLFYSNGGEGSMESVYLIPGEPYALPECGFTSATGSIFIGWQVNGVIYQPGDLVTITEGAVAYAQWERGKAVSFDPDGGSGSMATVYVLRGSQYALPECGFTAPSSSEYFQGWRLGSGSTVYQPGYVITVNANITVTAVWANKARIRFIAGSGTGSAYSVYVIPGVPYTLPECTFNPPQHAYFRGWKADSGSTVYQPGDAVTFTVDTTVAAQWTDYLHVAFNKNEGSGTDMNWLYVLPGGEVELPECTYMSPNSSMIFVGWQIPTLDNSIRAAGTRITVNENITAKAIWALPAEALKILFQYAPAGEEYVIKLFADIINPDTARPMTAYVREGQNIILDLNGHTVDRGLGGSDAVPNSYGYLFDVPAGSLTIRDTAGGGVITGCFCPLTNQTNAAAVANVTNANLTIEGGSFTNNRSNDGVIRMNGGTLTITGGTFTGSRTDNDPICVKLESGTAVISGGTIADFKDRAVNMLGTESRPAVLTVEGGSITGSSIGVKMSGPGNSLNVQGSPVITGNTGGVHLDENQIVNVTGELSSAALISIRSYRTVNAENPLLVTSGLPGRGSVSNFAAGRNGQAVGLNADGEVILSTKATVSFNANGAEGAMSSVVTAAGSYITLPECGFTTPEDMYFAGWSTDGTNVDYPNGENIQIMSDTALYAIWRPARPAFSGVFTEKRDRAEQDTYTDLRIRMRFTYNYTYYNNPNYTGTVLGAEGGMYSITEVGYRVWYVGVTSGNTYVTENTTTKVYYSDDSCFEISVVITGIPENRHDVLFHVSAHLNYTDGVTESTLTTPETAVSVSGSLNTD